MSDENCCGKGDTCTDDSVPEQIRLDQDVYEDLIELYVRKNMLPESYKVFNEYISSGSTLEDAATKAMVNEMANEALAAVVADVARANELIAAGNKEAGEAILKRYTFYKNNKKEDNNNDNSTEEEIPR